ncbi:hypothetical protein PXD04_09275 [Methanosphaera sp. ISO3-F5]|uniref:hypothetical protein n=1 Tax=Methanosphaera sp. ISO3-F5 TaxID=1452353 RepID=UPI002B25B6BB|nr:hypothetical protein [Methanosphaera sp. ISO3-F5]WQH63879.1 hypothetical protein PXD04_09275 [Methanosphaera sp. ISO3-F5]
MNKKIKYVFLFTSLLILLLGIASISAVDIDNTTITTKHADTVKNTNEINLQTTNKIQENAVNKKTNDNIKEAGNIDYYVSTTDGKDDNDGSHDAPFKTIQTAINKTDSENTYNIHLAEGTYKGEGNTNLTIPGDNHINIIGAGINKTIFDGEAKYDIQRSGFYWGSSDTWFYYVNGTGNWIMNITEGTGSISIENFTIQHSWSNGTRGGSAIGLYPETTVDNHGTLTAKNIYFHDNYSGLGAGIRNNPTGTLYVDNCVFENQTKSVSTGNFGSAIYNNGTAYVNNILVLHNYARWGSVTNDKTLYITNSTIKDGIGYDGTSGQKNGPGIYVNTGNADFFASYESEGLVTVVENCVFENNQQCDINTGKANITVNNCTFNKSTGIYLASNNAGTKFVHKYTNNKFIDMHESTMFVTMQSTTKPSYAIHSLANYNITIENNTIDVPVSQYSYAIQAKHNTHIINNTINNYIKIDGANCTVIDNNINTLQEYTVQLTRNAKEAQVTNNTLYAGYSNGDLSVDSASEDAIIKDNKPEAKILHVNNDNYTTYFDENGIARNNIIANGSQIVLVNNLTNKKFIFDNIVATVEVNTTLVNTTIVTQNNARISLNKLEIDNKNTDEDYVILFNSTNNKISNANIKVDSDKTLQTIKIEEDGNIINNSVINISAPAGNTIWNADYSIGNVETAGIFIRSSDNQLIGVKLYLDTTNKKSSSDDASVDGVDIQSKKVGEYVTGNIIRNTRINVTGGSYVYGLNIARATNTITPLSYYDVTSDNYAAAIQLGDSYNNNISGYIHSNANNTAYGFYSTAMSTGASHDNNISKLYIQGMQAREATGVLIEGASNIALGDATFTINGEKAVGVEIVPDWMGNKPENVTITKLTLNLNGQTNTSNLMTFNSVKNIYMNASTLKSTNGTGIILKDTSNATIIKNYINQANMIGGDAAVTSNTESTIENNTPTIAVLTDDTYPNLFDENNTLKVDAGIISLGGDLHNKILIFNNHTQVINITNIDDYTMYNTTLIIEGNGTYGDRYGFTVDGINFNNTNKPVFIDRFNGSGQKNVKFDNCNIYVTGDDIVAFDATNNNSYIYLDIDSSNITMNGKNVVAINYNGHDGNGREHPVYIKDTNIYLNATQKATALNTTDSTISFNNNNVEAYGKTVVMLDANKVSISYSSLQGNNFTGKADNITAINLNKGSRYSAYIRYNTINLSSPNPVTAVILSGERHDFEENTIIVDATNNETPVVLVLSPSINVVENYIQARDIYGDNAVNNTDGTVKDNTPNTSGFESRINVENITFKLNEEGKIRVNATDIFGDAITGIFTATINGETVPVVNNTITYTPSKLKDNILEVSFEDPNGKYNNNTVETTLLVKPLASSISIVSVDTVEVNNKVPITILLTNEHNDSIGNVNVTVSVDGNSQTLSVDKNGILIFNYTPTSTGKQEITVVFTGTEDYINSSNKCTINVLENQTKIIEDLNKTVNNQNKTINEQEKQLDNKTKEITELEKQLKDAEDKIASQNKTIDSLNKKLEDANKKIDNLSQTVKNLNNKISTLENIIKELNKTTPKLNTTITVNPVNARVGQKTVITANIKDQTGKNLANGKVVFKVNGVTLKDVNNNILYSYINNGTASITYKVPGGWIKNNTVQVIYSGSAKYNASKTTSSKVLNITKGNAKITFQDTRITGESGDKITLRTIVKDSNDDYITNGKVLFKINGKTIKNKNGKTLTANVKDGIATFTYSIPNNFAAKDYKLTAVLSSNYYNRAEAQSKLSLSKKDVTVNATSIKTSKGKTTLKGTIRDVRGKLLVIPSKMAVKVNGKTLLSKVSSKNGKFNLSFKHTLRKGTYELLLISGENSIYKNGRLTTVLKV